MKKLVFVIVTVLLSVTCFASRKMIKDETYNQEVDKRNLLLKRKIAIGCFSNEAQNGTVSLYDAKIDTAGKLAKDFLSADLASTGTFIVLERQDVDKIIGGLKNYGNQGFQEIGTEYLITGSISGSRKKNAGDSNSVTGIKNQNDEIVVSIRIIDVCTAQIIYSQETTVKSDGALKTIINSGVNTDSDGHLYAKAIQEAISKLTGGITNCCITEPWKTYIITQDLNGIYISGGKSQGLRIDDIYNVIERGKPGETPQTEIKIVTPGKPVARIKIHYVGGDTPENEFSMGSLIEGSIDLENLGNYYIMEIE